MKKKTKYFTFLYSTNAEKLVQTSLKKNRFIFEPPNNELIYKVTKNANKVYFLVANADKQIINAIIKQTEFKHDSLKFEIKTKNEVTYNELENSIDFNEKGMELFDEKPTSIFISEYSAKLYELNEKEEDIFEEIRDAMKSIYKVKKNNIAVQSPHNTQMGMNEGLKNIINNPFLYHMLNYQQMYIAMHKQAPGNNNNQPPMFPLPMFPYNNNPQNPMQMNQIDNKENMINEKENNQNLTNNPNGYILYDENLSDLSKDREKFFDLKDVPKYNELYNELQKKYDETTNRNNILLPSTPSKDDNTENDSSSSRKDDSYSRITKRKSSTHYNKISSSNSRTDSIKKRNKRKHSRSRERSYSSSSQKDYNDSDRSSNSEEGIYAKKILNDKKKKTIPKNYQYNRDFIPYKQNNYGYNSYQKYNQYTNKPINNYQYYNSNYNYMYNKNNNQNRMGNMYGRRGNYYQRDRNQNDSMNQRK